MAKETLTDPTPEPAAIVAYQLADHERRLRDVEEAVGQMPLLKKELETQHDDMLEIKAEMRGTRRALWGLVISILGFTLSLLVALTVYALTN